MTTPNDGGPAFPGGERYIRCPDCDYDIICNDPNNGCDCDCHLKSKWTLDGMSLRKLFAAAALASSAERVGGWKHPQQLAADMYEIADAMIAEGERENE